MSKKTAQLRKKLRVSFAKLSRLYFIRRSQLNRSTLLTSHLRNLYCEDEIVVRTKGGFRMSVSPRDYISHRIFFFGQYDEEMSSVIQHHVWQGQTVWDIGAERGWFTLLMASTVGKEGRVDAFEAFPPTLDRLKANVQLNQMSWVNVNGVAISESTGKMWFVPPHYEGHGEKNCGGIGYLTNTFAPDSIEVPTITLDEYAERTGVKELAFIKMDIEGAEYDALKGAANIIKRCHPIIAIEYNALTSKRAGSSMKEVDALLDSFGYDRFTFQGHYTKLDISQLDPDEDHVFNVYCFPKR